MEKKIIGFKLIKYYPGSPKIGEETRNKASEGYWAIRNGAYSEDSLLSKYSEFWQPIYEEEKVIDLNEILYEDSFPCKIGPREVIPIMKRTAETTIDFVIDYLNDVDARQGQSDKVWREDLKKRIR
jgi:hypothetical protein